MAEPILWAPGILWFFLLENPHAHKIPPVVFFGRGGWKCQFYFYGRGDFSDLLRFKKFEENQTCTESRSPFCVAFATLFQRGKCPFPVPETLLFLGSPTVSTESPAWIARFPLPSKRGQTWRELVALEIQVHVWFVSESVYQQCGN